MAIALRQLAATDSSSLRPLNCIAAAVSRLGAGVRVSVPCTTPPGDWEAWVDATNGAVHEICDRTVHARARPPRLAGTGQGWSSCPIRVSPPAIQRCATKRMPTLPFPKRRTRESPA